MCRTATSLEQGLLQVGCDVRWLGGSAAADVSARLSSSSSLVVVRLMQAYYTIACEPPASPATLFAGAVHADNLAPYIGEGNPPAYVSSVTFGRTLMFVIQSMQSATDLQAAVNAAFNGVATEGAAELETRSTMARPGGSRSRSTRTITPRATGHSP